MPRLLYRPLILLALILSCTSCGDLLLPPLEILSVNIQEGYNDASTLADVQVRFDRAPSPPSIYKSFSLSRDGNAMGGEFLIDGPGVRFIPTEGFSSGHDYLLRITTGAEDEKGLSISTDYTLKFSTKLEGIRPRIISVSPADEARVDDCTAIHITFSESVDPISFKEECSLQPTLRTRTEWDASMTVATLIPLENLEAGKKYTLSIGEGLQDAAGNTLGAPYKSSFTYGTDTTAPDYDLLWVDRDGMEHPLVPNTENPALQTGAKIVIRFTEPVEIESLSGYVKSIPDRAPSFKSDLETKKEASITFGTQPAWGSKMILRIMDGIEDESGNKFDQVREYTLLFDAESSRPPKILEARLCVDPRDADHPRYAEISQGTAFTSISLDPLIFPTNSLRASHMDVFFHVSGEASGLDLISLMEGLAISGTNSCASFTITSIDANPTIDAGSYPVVPEGKIIAVRFGLDVENGTVQGLLWFKAPKGLMDSLRNTSEEDWSIPLCKV